MLKVNGANGSVHGTEEEEQIWTASSTWKARKNRWFNQQLRIIKLNFYNLYIQDNIWFSYVLSYPKVSKAHIVKTTPCLEHILSFIEKSETVYFYFLQLNSAHLSPPVAAGCLTDGNLLSFLLGKKDFWNTFELQRTQSIMPSLPEATLISLFLTNIHKCNKLHKLARYQGDWLLIHWWTVN